MNEAQQVAMIRAMLFFMGKQQWQPTSAVVTTQLREMNASAGWDVKVNQAPVAPPAKTWDVKSNRAV